MDEKIKNILYDLKFGDRAKIKEAKNKIEFLWKENSSHSLLRSDFRANLSGRNGLNLKFRI
mgnify:CR=1 FL=1